MSRPGLISPARQPTVGARHCLALIRRRPAPPTIPRHCLALIRRRPAPPTIPRHCLALIRRRPAPPTINGEPVQTDDSPDTPLLWAVRDSFKLKGSKYGCGRGLCGACTMHVDGQAVRTCILPVSAVAGKQVTTIEGLGTPDSPHPLQAAWASLSVPQCGYCQPGQIMSAAALLASNQNPSEDHVEQAMAKEGDLAAGFEAAAAVVENDYWAPYLAHAPMEPMNAVAHVQGDHADVWCGTQGIGAAQKIVARLANLDIDKVRAHSVYLGGGFGRRATLTHVVEATQISLATGKPIQVLWSHEDDLKSGVFRPASLMRIKAGVDQDGRISAWQAKRVGAGMLTSRPGSKVAALPTMISDGVVDWISGMAEGAMDGWVVDPTSPDEESQACGVDIVGATHASPAPVVLGCPEVGAMHASPLRSTELGPSAESFLLLRYVVAAGVLPKA